MIVNALFGVLDVLPEGSNVVLGRGHGVGDLLEVDGTRVDGFLAFESLSD